jgi:hypothetical protein
MNEMLNWDVLFALAAGLGLAAACGLRVFAPLLVLGLAARFGPLTLSPGFAWAEGTPALIALGLATLLEITAYYVPWVDNALDAIAAPVALFAGVVAVAALTGDLPPWLRWTLAIVAGGGLAGLTQFATTLLRLKSTGMTGGLGNPVIATGEWIGAFTLAVIAVLVPLLALALAVGLVVLVFRGAKRLVARRAAPSA